MNATAQRRLASLAVLLALVLLVAAVGVQAALAMYVTGSGGGASFASATTAQAGTQGRGGISAAVPADMAQAGTQGRGGIAAAAAAAEPASSGTSTTTWILIGLAAALAVFIAAWAVVRSRGRSREPSQAYCAQHPEEALCGAA